MIPLAKDWTKPALLFSEIGYKKKELINKKSMQGLWLHHDSPG